MLEKISQSNKAFRFNICFCFLYFFPFVGDHTMSKARSYAYLRRYFCEMLNEEFVLVCNTVNVLRMRECCDCCMRECSAGEKYFIIYNKKKSELRIVTIQ